MATPGLADPRDLLPKYDENITRRVTHFKAGKQRIRGEDFSCFLFIGL
jgi:hypothetical protein